MQLFSRCIWSLLENRVYAILFSRQLQYGRFVVLSLNEATHLPFKPQLWWRWPSRVCHLPLWGPWSSLLIVNLSHQTWWGFVSITRSTVNICHKFEPNDFYSNMSSFKIPVGEGRYPRIEERAHQSKEKKSKNQTHPSLPYFSMEKDGTTYHLALFTTCFLLSSGNNRIIVNFVFSFF